MKTSDVGVKISDKTKKAGDKISGVFKDIKQSETTQKAKFGILRFATKVKNLFKDEKEEEKKEEEEEKKEEEEEVKAEGEDIGMIKLEGQEELATSDNEED